MLFVTHPRVGERQLNTLIKSSSQPVSLCRERRKDLHYHGGRTQTILLVQLVWIAYHRQIKHIDRTHIVCTLVRMVWEQYFDLGKGAARFAIKEIAQLLEQGALYALVLNTRARLHDRHAVEQLVFLLCVPCQTVGVGAGCGLR